MLSGACRTELGLCSLVTTGGLYYTLGHELSYVDFVLWNYLDNIRALTPSLLDHHPLLKVALPSATPSINAFCLTHQSAVLSVRYADLL